MDVKHANRRWEACCARCGREIGWTLKEMSQRTNIPVSTLSKVEHDRLTLTYDKLVQLSQRLNIRISELFADTAEQRRAGRDRAPQYRPHR